ncbi:MAG: hypothetical protein KGP10_07490 [Actinomycetales bacterium]|nr:hypothetical protein [Actinomycetales bacterium]
MSTGDPAGIGPGQIGLILLLVLAAAVAVIGFALTRSLRAAQQRVEHLPTGESAPPGRGGVSGRDGAPAGEAPSSPAPPT